MTIQQNNGQIQTTHVGSLPRPHALLDIMKRKYAGQAYDSEALEAQLRSSVMEVVGRQAASGID
ncbi:MAG: hypothetical protein WBL86_20795, partial [Pseudolabrys sp.]